ncbi:MAG: aminoacetone oxidase family FAD-binding enzyme [Oscillospiraceae bacterium]|nr:aminoacetone oxidase family FAD-binding enzyme [Oscillospiraceae bacterium]
MTVTVIGGGAAGMVAALTAARRGHRVLLLERQSRVGRKLLSTGNGRCNLTNHRADTEPTHYHGADPAFVLPALRRFGVADTLRWFSELGLMTAEEPDGRIYPRSNMAGSVLDVLRYALDREKIELHTGCAAEHISVKDHHFTVLAGTSVFHSDAVILAAGGAAGGKVGGVRDGYTLSEELGHRTTALHPSLVQIKTDPTYPRALKGVKAEAALRLLRGEKLLAEGGGEVLFTEYGVSGPAIFDLSRAVSGADLTLELDLLPELHENDTFAWLCARRTAMGEQEAQTLLTGALHARLGQIICKASGFTSQIIRGLTDADLRRIARTAHRFSLPVTGVCGFDQAQVTAGGLRTDEFDPQTLQSRLVPGFYACGEVLDVDGDCGGYNLQWAWSSGRLAGMLE